VSTPEQDAKFVACMEESLENYAESYDPKHPRLCMDEQPIHLLKEIRVPIAATRERQGMPRTGTLAAQLLRTLYAVL
jgi:hypothetical protein